MNQESPYEADDTTNQPFSNVQLKTEDLPRWEDVAFEPLARAAPWEFFLVASLVTLTAILALSISFVLPVIPFGFVLMAQFSILILFSLSQWHNFAEHKVRGIALRERDMIFRKGLFWQQSTLLPFCRVQHLELHRNPLERHLGLSSLRIYTAGGSGIDLLVRGLENERAERIKQYILERSKTEFSGR